MMLNEIRNVGEPLPDGAGAKHCIWDARIYSILKVKTGLFGTKL